MSYHCAMLADQSVSMIIFSLVYVEEEKNMFKAWVKSNTIEKCWEAYIQVGAVIMIIINILPHIS